MLTLFYVARRVPQTLSAYIDASTLEGAKQTIAVGPSRRNSPSRCWARTAAASSTPIPRIRSRTRMRSSNLIQMVTIFAIGAALTNVFGRMVGDQRRGWAILGAMGVIFLVGVAVAYWAEARG